MRSSVVVLCALLVVGCGGSNKKGGDDLSMMTDSDGGPSSSDLAGADLSGVDMGGLAAPTCSTACSIGAKSCDGNGVRSCVAVGTCSDWSAPVPCGGGGVCSGGECVGTCKNQCDQGATYCSQNGFRTCAVGMGGCTDWSTTVTACQNAAVCSGGACTDKCIDRCAPGDVICAGFGVQKCERKFSGCLDWSDPSPCDTGKVCQAGQCVASCTDQCTAAAAKCDGADSIANCEKQASGCNDFSIPQLCQSGVCSSDACQTCTDMAKRCSVQGNVEQCNNGVFTQTASCAFGCTGGACTVMVSCNPGEQHCNGNSVEICNSTGSAFLFSETCAHGCIGGLCQGTCTENALRCNGNTPQKCTSGAFVDQTPCTTFCQSGQCALDGLTISSAMDLNGLVLVKGAVTVSGAGSITSSSGSLTIQADSITINDGAMIIISPTATGGPGLGGVAFESGCGGSGGSYGASGGSTCTGAGAIYGSDFDSSIAQGSQGGSGLPASVAGGLGGGVLSLIATTSINMAGIISVKGAQGAASTTSAGGGSGGGVLIAADSVTITGDISTSGGLGGGSAGGAGGAGGNGRVKILFGSMSMINDDGITNATRTTDIMPPLVIASSTHPDQTLTYNNGAPALGFAWQHPFPGAQGFYEILNTTAFTQASQLPGPSTTTGLIRQDLISLDPTALVAGQNLFHITSVSATSMPGAVESTFTVNVTAAPPALSSSSHPSQQTFSTNHDAFFQWTNPSALPDANFSSFFYIRDDFGDTIPDSSATPLPVSQKQQLLTLTDGIHAFHIIAADTQGYFTKTAAHYAVRMGPMASPSPGVGTVTGIITQMGASGFVGVQGANVTINRGLLNLGGANTDQTTASDGSFTFNNNVPANTPAQAQWEIRVTRTGFQPATTLVSVTPGGTTNVALHIVANP